MRRVAVRLRAICLSSSVLVALGACSKSPAPAPAPSATAPSTTAPTTTAPTTTADAAATGGDTAGGASGAAVAANDVAVAASDAETKAATAPGPALPPEAVGQPTYLVWWGDERTYQTAWVAGDKTIAWRDRAARWSDGTLWDIEVVYPLFREHGCDGGGEGKPKLEPRLLEVGIAGAKKGSERALTTARSAAVDPDGKNRGGHRGREVALDGGMGDVLFVRDCVEALRCDEGHVGERVRTCSGQAVGGDWDLGKSMAAVDVRSKHMTPALGSTPEERATWKAVVPRIAWGTFNELLVQRWVKAAARPEEAEGDWSSGTRLVTHAETVPVELGLPLTPEPVIQAGRRHHAAGAFGWSEVPQAALAEAYAAFKVLAPRLQSEQPGAFIVWAKKGDGHETAWLERGKAVARRAQAMQWFDDTLWGVETRWLRFRKFECSMDEEAAVAAPTALEPWLVARGLEGKRDDVRTLAPEGSVAIERPDVASVGPYYGRVVELAGGAADVLLTIDCVTYEGCGHGEGRTYFDCKERASGGPFRLAERIAASATVLEAATKPLIDKGVAGRDMIEVELGAVRMRARKGEAAIDYLYTGFAGYDDGNISGKSLFHQDHVRVHTAEAVPELGLDATPDVVKAWLAEEKIDGVYGWSYVPGGAMTSARAAFDDASTLPPPKPKE